MVWVLWHTFVSLPSQLHTLIYKTLHDLAPGCSSFSTMPTLMVIRPHWHPCCSSNIWSHSYLRVLPCCSFFQACSSHWCLFGWPHYIIHICTPLVLLIDEISLITLLDTLYSPLPWYTFLHSPCYYLPYTIFFYPSIDCLPSPPAHQTLKSIKVASWSCSTLYHQSHK